MAPERTFLVQRCQQHKQRNVAEHLSKHHQAEFRRKIAAAYGMMDYAEAKKALESCLLELDRINPSAAVSLREGMEETLTLHRLEAPALLRVSPSTTNPMESPFATVRERTWRVALGRGARPSAALGMRPHCFGQRRAGDGFEAQIPSCRFVGLKGPSRLGTLSPSRFPKGLMPALRVMGYHVIWTRGGKANESG